MPQFPHQPEKPEAKPNPDLSHESNGQVAAKEKEPIKFKLAQPTAPVSRVRIKGAPPKSSSTKNPFKDDGLFEDKESLARFRDDFGRPLILTIAAIAAVFLIYRLSVPTDQTAVMNETLAPLYAQADQFDATQAASPEEFQSRIELADQLIGFTKEVEAVDRGAELKLRTLTTLNSIALERQNIQTESLDLLEATSRQFINSRNKKVSNYAKLGLTLIRVGRYLESPDKAYFPEILDQFKLVSSFATDDIVSAKNLLRVADAFSSSSFSDEAAQFYRAVNVACSASHNEEIAAIGGEARSRVSGSDSVLEELNQILAEAKESKKFPLQIVRNKIAENTREDTVSGGKLESILDFCEQLLQQDAVPPARKILDDIASSIYLISAGIERDSIKKRYDNIQTIVKHFGEAFEFEGLYSVEGRPISQSSLQRKPKLVLFWSPENAKSIKLINRLSDSYLQFVQRKIQVVAIATITDNVDDRNKILDMSNQTRGIEFLTLVKGDSESQAFSSRYPIPKVPFWMLLDQNDRIRGFNTSPAFIRLNVD